MIVNYIDDGGAKYEGIVTHSLLEDESIELNFEYHLGQKSTRSDNCFSALQLIRKELEGEGISILCNGASLNVYPSGMMLDMGNGERAYRLRDGLQPSLSDIVNIFDFDEVEFIEGTVVDQEEYFTNWRTSKKRKRLKKPKYKIGLINPESTFVYFWGHQPNKDGEIGKSCLSQWWPCVFQKDKISYKSTEHWMMAEKARAFLDTEILSKLLESKTPKEAKDLGRQVSNFSEDVWRLKSYSIVVTGNFLKFSQNKELKNYLLSTEDAIIVEASPYDKIWGIGLKQDDEGVEDPKNWKGENLLGFALMEVRDLLREDHPA